MIVAEQPEGIRFVTQPAHAALAGQFADHWGNATFGRPAPTPSVALAAHVHDDGWWARDRRPHLKADGTPENFTEIEPDPWIACFDAGVEAAVDLDPYAGLLVSMHGTGLRRRRYGRSPSWPPTPEAFGSFVERQEARQRHLAEKLLEDPEGGVTETDLEVLHTLHETGSPPDGCDSRLWRNYALLQAWDTLSLSFCTTASPPAYEEIGPIPTGQTGEDESLEVDALSDGSFVVDPYPFDVESLVVSVRTRTVREQPFENENALLGAYYGSDLEVEEVVLRQPNR